jgi:carboxypeptidase C (cathepsin A)
MSKRNLSGLRLGWLAAAALLVALPSIALELTADMTTDEPLLAPPATRHSVRVDGRELRYEASFVEMPLVDDEGKTQATISATCYVLLGKHDVARRPVLFAFNGGPGASSSPLHFGAFGPRRWSHDSGEARRIVPNEHSLIDVADIVFIDPVGTGFSRVRPDGDASRYWNPQGDAQAVVTFIRTWLNQRGRTQSPVFIAGESYGGFRLAMSAPHLKDLEIAGLIFISPLLDASASASAPGNELPYIFELPTLAAGAWYHNRIDRAGRTVDQHFETAAKFAQTEYAAALLQGNTLPPAERKRIAQRMSELIGLPAATIEAANLRIDSEQFLNTLLADENKIVGRLDMRVTAPTPMQRDASRPAGADDPALGLRGSNVIKSEPIKKYFSEQLGVDTERDYLSLTLDVNFRWDWRGPAWPPQYYVNPTVNVTKLLEEKPQARVLLLGGYYDLAVPVLAPRYAFAHSGIAPERVQITSFVAGHSPFDGEENLPRFNDVVRKFVLAHTPSR